MKVLKFGGSSVGSPLQIKVVKSIVESQPSDSVIVVSAFQGVTDQLVKMGKMAVSRDKTYLDELMNLEKRHLDAVSELVPLERKNEGLEHVKELLVELENILQGVFLLQDLTPRTQDKILSFGERLSSFIVSRTIENATWIDSRDLIKTDNHFGNARVDFLTTDKLIKGNIGNIEGLIVVPGFIASTMFNETTTLGRGGSDYTAAIIAAALDATVLETWTDVDGFMTADPRKVQKAYAIDTLSYAEAIELSHFGAKVIYTPTIRPVYNKNIPIAIRNTFNLEAKGTIIGNTGESSQQSQIKGISSIDNVSLVSVQGTGMVGVSGVSTRIFSALARARANIILISQASSEYSICLAVDPNDAGRAKLAIEEEFYYEMGNKGEIRVIVEEDLSIIAIVGESMKNTPGISANLFQSLGRNGISVIATAQGSSELNISVVIRQESLRKALNVIHEGFFLSHYKELHLFMFGIGNVGASLLKQIGAQQSKLMDELRLKINLTGVANSKKMWINPGGIGIDTCREELLKNGEPLNAREFIHQMTKLNFRNSVFIDCTANDQVSLLYKDVLSNYMSVVTANKIACSSEYAYYEGLKNTAKKNGVRFMFETNVGAGLPIINTINDLIRSGDKILRIEAVVSGTLNFIFSELSADKPLSQVIRRAMELGYSEPDPRIDLSGTDVVRKLLILAREAGYKVEKEDVEMHPFLPVDCFSGTLDDFWTKVKEQDASFEAERAKMEAKGLKWRFVATLDHGKPLIELRGVGADHPFYHLEGSNNIIVLSTARYNEQPMIIKGYGAGAEVTAAGVFADIIRVANV